MTTTFLDSFTDADDVLLGSHTPDIGTWRALGLRFAIDVDLLHIQSNHVETVTLAAGEMSPTQAHDEDDILYRYAMRLAVDAAGGLRHFGRLNAGAADFYELTVATPSPDVTFTLREYEGGVPTDLGNWTDTAPSFPKIYNIRMELFDAAKRVLIDSIERINSASNNVGGASARDSSFVFNPATTASNIQVDDYEVGETPVVGNDGLIQEVTQDMIHAVTRSAIQ